MALDEVDGMSERMVDEWFEDADANRDGRVAGEEAKAFFRRTGLSVADLSKVCASLLSACGNGNHAFL